MCGKIIETGQYIKYNLVEHIDTADWNCLDLAFKKHLVILIFFKACSSGLDSRLKELIRIINSAKSLTFWCSYVPDW